VHGIPKRRPSRSLVVAGLALIVALAGTAIAGPIAVKSVLNKQEKKQVKKIAKNQANRQIVKQAAGLSVANAVNATNAQNATSANNANSVDGLSAAKFGKVYTTTTAFEDVLDLGGFRIEARCVDNGGVTLDDLFMRGRTNVNSATALVGVVGNTGASAFTEDQDFNTGDTGLNLRPGDFLSTQGTVTYTTPGGAGVTVNYQASELASGAGCRVAGVALGG